MLATGAARPSFEDQILKILLVKDLDVDVWVQFAKQADLSVFLGHEGLLHRRKLDVKIEFGQVKVRRECLADVAVPIPLNRKAARLIVPVDAVKIQQIGKNCSLGCENVFCRMPTLRDGRIP